MPTPRETILQALLAALQTMPVATVLREGVLPERVPPAGLLILRDGDPSMPEIMLSRLTYYYCKRNAQLSITHKLSVACFCGSESLVEV